MQRSKLLRFVTVTAAAVVMGCSSGNPADSAATASRFERALGTGSPTDIIQRTDKVFSKYQFELHQRGELPNLYIETKWRNRAPFEDEEALGIVAAQTRAIVRGQRRIGGTNSEIYAAVLTVENRVQRERDGAWYDNVATKQYLAFANQITADLKYELEIGVRR